MAISQNLPYELKGNVFKLVSREHNVKLGPQNEIIQGSMSDLEKIYQLDSSGRVIEIIENELDSTFYSSTKYKYDTIGNLIEEFTINKYGESNSMEYILNQKFQIIRENRYRNKKLISYYTYQYDDNFLVEKKSFDSSGKLIRSYGYLYDSNGNKIKTIWSSEGKEEFEEFEYDQYNRRVSYSLFSESKYAYTYYENGLLKTQSFFEDEGIKWKKEYVYDSEENLIKETHFDYNPDKTRIQEYSYKFDSLGNLIERIFSENGELKYSNVYEIYYK